MRRFSKIFFFILVELCLVLGAAVAETQRDSKPRPSIGVYTVTITPSVIPGAEPNIAITPVTAADSDAESASAITVSVPNTLRKGSSTVTATVPSIPFENESRLAPANDAGSLPLFGEEPTAGPEQAADQAGDAQARRLGAKIREAIAKAIHATPVVRNIAAGWQARQHADETFNERMSLDQIATIAGVAVTGPLTANRWLLVWVPLAVARVGMVWNTVQPGAKENGPKQSALATLIKNKIPVALFIGVTAGAATSLLKAALEHSGHAALAQILTDVVERGALTGLFQVTTGIARYEMMKVLMHFAKARLSKKGASSVGLTASLFNDLAGTWIYGAFLKTAELGEGTDLKPICNAVFHWFAR